MSEIAIQNVLREMSRLSSQAAGLEGMQGQQAQQAQGAGEAFANILSRSLEQVSELQSTASATSGAFQRGEPDVDIAQVMIALEKSSVAFEAVTQTRNRLLTAYRDVMNMSV